jgi:hypothetical protein
MNTHIQECIQNTSHFFFFSQDLPDPVKGVHVANELDLLIAKNRKAEMEHIVEQATKLRVSATDINDALGDVEGYLASLEHLAVEVRWGCFCELLILLMCVSV